MTERKDSVSMSSTGKIADLLAKFDELSPEEQEYALETLQSKNGLAAIIAALEETAERERQCPHCQAPGAQRRGTVSGLARYACRECGRTYNALTGTDLARLRMKERWLEMAASLTDLETVRQSATRCDVHKNTALRWRHRFLRAAGRLKKQVKIGGVAEADIIEMKPSEKGSRTLTDNRPPRERGESKKEGEKAVSVFTIVERGGDLRMGVLQAPNAGAIRYELGNCIKSGTIITTDAAKNFGRTFRKMGVHHERINLAQQQRVRGPYHVQTINGIHARLRGFLRAFNGVATKYLPLYLEWFCLIEHRHITARFAFFSTVARGIAA
jgi:transposase-like protein